jgi:hypothetical protein
MGFYGTLYGSLWRTYLPWPSPWARHGGQVCSDERGGRRHGMCGGHRGRGRARGLHPALLAAPQIAQGIVERLQHGIVRRREFGRHRADARSDDGFAESMCALPTVSQRVRGGHSCRAQAASYRRTQTRLRLRGRPFTVLCMRTPLRQEGAVERATSSHDSAGGRRDDDRSLHAAKLRTAIID